MARISGCKPRDPHDYMNILAGVNARAAAADRSQSVSPACHVLYLDPHARPQDPGSQSEIYGNGQIPPDDFVPAILGNLFGIDLYSVTRDLLMRSSDSNAVRRSASSAAATPASSAPAAATSSRMPALLPRSDSGALPAISCASARAAPGSASASTTEFTSPQRSAVAASMRRPVRNSSRVRAPPIVVRKRFRPAVA